MNWGKSIVLAFVLFAVFIATLVIVCVREDISLVSRTYYQEEIDYEQQLTRLRNVQALAHKPVIHLENSVLTISYEDFELMENGELNLFRPSDARWDRAFALSPGDESLRLFEVNDLPAGMYKARLKWQMNGKEYFMEELIHL